MPPAENVISWISGIWVPLASFSRCISSFNWSIESTSLLDGFSNPTIWFSNNSLLLFKPVKQYSRTLSPPVYCVLICQKRLANIDFVEVQASNSFSCSNSCFWKSLFATCNAALAASILFLAPAFSFDKEKIPFWVSEL